MLKLFHRSRGAAAVETRKTAETAPVPLAAVPMILGWLEPKDVACSARCCKEWSRIVREDDGLWLCLCQRRLGFAWEALTESPIAEARAEKSVATVCVWRRAFEKAWKLGPFAVSNTAAIVGSEAFPAFGECAVDRMFWFEPFLFVHSSTHGNIMPVRLETGTWDEAAIKRLPQDAQSPNFCVTDDGLLVGFSWRSTTAVDLRGLFEREKPEWAELTKRIWMRSPMGAHRICWDGRRNAFISSGGEITCIWLKDGSKEKPRPIRPFRAPSTTVQSMALSCRSTLAVGSSADVIRLFEVSQKSPSHPKFICDINVRAPVRALRFDSRGDHLAAIAGVNGSLPQIFVFDVSAVTHPRMVSTFSPALPSKSWCNDSDMTFWAADLEFCRGLLAVCCPRYAIDIIEWQTGRPLFRFPESLIPTSICFIQGRDPSTLATFVGSWGHASVFRFALKPPET